MLSIIRARSRLVGGMLGLFSAREPSSLLEAGPRPMGSGAEAAVPRRVGIAWPGPSWADSLETYALAENLERVCLEKGVGGYSLVLLSS